MPNKIINMGVLEILLWQKGKTVPHLRSIITWESRSNKLNLYQHIRMKLILVKSIKCWFVNINLSKSELNAVQIPKKLYVGSRLVERDFFFSIFLKIK